MHVFNGPRMFRLQDPEAGDYTISLQDKMYTVSFF